MVESSKNGNFQQNNWKQKLLGFYGDYLNFIEFLLIFGVAGGLYFYFLTGVTILQPESPYYITFTIIIVFFIHRHIISKIAQRESHPLAVLRNDRTASFIFWLGFGGFALGLTAPFISAYTGVLESIPAILGISLFLVTFSSVLIFATFFLFLTGIFKPISAHKEARLCFKLVSEEMNRLANAETDIRLETSLKNITWLRRGFHRFNRFVLKTHHQQIVDLESYYWVAYNHVLVGTQEEHKKLADFVSQLFNSTGKASNDCDVKQFLIVLQSIKGEKQEESINQLSRMLRPMSFSERMKPLMTSQYTRVIISLITMIGVIIKIFQDLGLSS